MQKKAFGQKFLALGYNIPSQSEKTLRIFNHSDKSSGAPHLSISTRNQHIYASHLAYLFTSVKKMGDLNYLTNI